MLQKPIRLLARGHGLGMLVLLAFVLVPMRGMSAETRVDENSRAGRYSKVFIGVSFNLFSPSQSDFRDIYRPIIVHPQIRAGYFISPKAYVFSTFDFFTLNGKTPEWQMDARLTQRILSLGAGYRTEISGKISASGALSGVYLSYQEEIPAIAVKDSSSCLGFAIESALDYRFGNKIRGITCLSYTNVQKTHNEVTAKFGGFRLGMGVLYCF
jgi:hypothetical protein